MGILDRLLRRKRKEETEIEEVDLQSIGSEDFIEESMIEVESGEAEEDMFEGEERFLKVMHLYGLSDVSLIERELKLKNIIILDVSLMKQSNGSLAVELKRAVDQLRGIIRVLKGDIALLDEKYILVTPSDFKIWRRGEEAEEPEME